MNLFKIFTLVFVLSIAGISEGYSQKEIFIKQVEFELEILSDIDYENEYFLTLKFNKGSKYIFTISNNVNDRPGNAVVELLDADNLVLTNVLGDKYFDKISFECNKTGFYDLLVRFQDNELGHCYVDVTLLQ
jgi:hypothetical protein